MPKTGGDITKKRILDTAERLFAKKGFDGTGMEEIASQAEINKATIYYHFKSKSDIMEALFKNVIEELNEYLNTSINETEEPGNKTDLSNKIKKEIAFIASKRKIITVMMMESLKSSDTNNFLFKCAELVIENEMKLHKETVKSKKEKYEKDKNEFFVYEFFTGFIPFITYVIFKEKWIDYFKIDEKKLIEYFMDSFKQTHLKDHI